MPKYLKPVDLDDDGTEDLSTAETTADEPEPAEGETVETPFGKVTRTKSQIAEPRTQSENPPEFTPFRVGQISTDFWGSHTLQYLTEGGLDLKNYRMALPRPNWPEPGAIATPEIEAEHSRENEIYFNANQRLKDVLVFLKFNPDPDNLEWSEESIQRAGENLKFLQGLWTARGFRIPPREELVAMACQTTLAPDEIPAKSQHYKEYFEEK